MKIKSLIIFILFFGLNVQASEECSKSQFHFDKSSKEFQFLVCPQNITYQGRFEMGKKFIVDELTYQDQFFVPPLHFRHCMSLS